MAGFLTTFGSPDAHPLLAGRSMGCGLVGPAAVPPWSLNGVLDRLRVLAGRGVALELLVAGSASANTFQVTRVSDNQVGIRAIGHSAFQVKTNLIFGGNDSVTDDGNPRLWLYNGATPKVLLGLSGSVGVFELASDSEFRWDSGTSVTGSVDLGLARTAAGVLSVHDADATGDPSVALQAKSSTTARRDRLRVDTSAIDNTDATRKYRATLNVYDTAARVGLRLDADGSRGTASVPAGGSSSTARVGGSVFDHFADASNGTTVETDLYSDTLAASTLSVNGDKAEAQYAGVFVSSATATRQVRVYFGGTLVFDTGALTLSLSAAWDCWVTCIRVSASVVRVAVSLTTEGAALAAYTAYTEVTGLTLTNTQVLKITGQAAGVGAATNDIVAKLGSVKFYPAA